MRVARDGQMAGDEVPNGVAGRVDQGTRCVGGSADVIYPLHTS